MRKDYNICFRLFTTTIENAMKKILIWASLAIFLISFSSISASAKDIPSGIRMEIVSDDDDDNEFEVFTYKDADGTFGYYLGLGRVFRVFETLGIEVLGVSEFDVITEACLCLGSTKEEALATLDFLLAFMDKDVDTVTGFPARMVTGAERLGAPTNIDCVVKKKFLRGKFLRFHFICNQRRAEADLT